MFADISIEGDFCYTVGHVAFPLILAYCNDHDLQIYDEEGSQTHNLTWISDWYGRSQGAAKLRRLCLWHPLKPIVIIELPNRLILWSHSTGVKKECETAHKLPLSCMQWNQDGNLLVTCDSSGICTIWKYDDVTDTLQSHQSILTSGSAVIKTVFIKSGQLWYFGCMSENGAFYFGDVQTSKFEIQDLELSAKVKDILADGNNLILLAEDLTLCRLTIASGRVLLDKQAKLGNSNGVDMKRIRLILLKNGIICLSLGGKEVLIIDLNSDEMSRLSIPAQNALISGLLFASELNDLYVSTDAGDLFSLSISQMENGVDALKSAINETSKFDSAIQDLSFVGGQSLVLCKQSSLFRVASRKESLKCAGSSLVLIQTSSTKLALYGPFSTETSKANEIDFQMNVKSIALYDRKFLISSGGKVVLFDVEDDLTCKQASKFAHSSSKWVMTEKSLFCRGAQETSTVEVLNFEGVVKQSFMISSEKSSLLSMSSNGNFVAAASSDCYISLFDDSKRDAKSVIVPKCIRGYHKIAEVFDIAPNSDGSAIALQCKISDSGKSRLFVYSIEKEAILSGFELTDIYSFQWDQSDPRLLVSVQNVNSASSSKEILFIFVSIAEGLKLYEKQPAPINFNALISSKCPYIFEAAKGDTGIITATRGPLPVFYDQDLDSLTALDKQKLTSAMMHFAFEVTFGHLEKALAHAKSLGKTTPWDSIVAMCIKSSRLDLAKTCLGMAGKASILSHLRKPLSNNPDIDKKKKLAFLAMNFKLAALAEKIYSEINDHPAIEYLMTSQNKWQEVLEFSLKHDRIAEKNLRFKYASYLKQTGSWEDAVKEFEASGTHQHEVPLMYAEKPREFADTILSRKEYQIWLGRSAEAQNDLTTAFEYYKLADEAISMIRILCIKEQIEDAIELSSRSNHSSASYNYIAKYFEKEEKWHEAIEWYTKGKCYHHAIRIAKQQELHLEMLQIAITGPKDIMQEIAFHFETNGEIDKAANLYFKSGRLSKAIEMCALRPDDCRHIFEMISTVLNDSSDIQVLQACAKYFSQVGDHTKALDLMIKSNNIDEAIKICKIKNVRLPDDVAERMVESTEAAKQGTVARKMADLLLDQGSFATACKLYTKAGDRIKAMQSLLRTGDVEKITFFASVSGSKQPEIYAITANYLQSLSWRDNPDIVRNIINFYTKAKAYDSLAVFYESFAQAEVDESSDYTKALGALQEAQKILGRYENTAGPPQVSRILNRIIKKIDYVNLMSQAQTIIDGGNGDIETGMKLCQNMMEIIRTDSVFSPTFC